MESFNLRGEIVDKDWARKVLDAFAEKYDSKNLDSTEHEFAKDCFIDGALAALKASA